MFYGVKVIPIIYHPLVVELVELFAAFQNISVARRLRYILDLGPPLFDI